MGIARGWEKRVIWTNITYAKRTVRIFSVSPQSRSLFSASFHTFCLTARAYFNTQKYGLFCSLITCRSRALISLIFISQSNDLTGQPRRENSFCTLLSNFSHCQKTSSLTLPHFWLLWQRTANHPPTLRSVPGRVICRCHSDMGIPIPKTLVIWAFPVHVALP